MCLYFCCLNVCVKKLKLSFDMSYLFVITQIPQYPKIVEFSNILFLMNFDVGLYVHFVINLIEFL